MSTFEQNLDLAKLGLKNYKKLSTFDQNLNHKKKKINIYVYNTIEHFFLFCVLFLCVYQVSLYACGVVSGVLLWHLKRSKL